MPAGGESGRVRTGFYLAPVRRRFWRRLAPLGFFVSGNAAPSVLNSRHGNTLRAAPMSASNLKSTDFDDAGEPWAPGEWPLLLRRWLRNPIAVAELAPTSRWVAEAVSAKLELNRPGAVIELGAGTGSLTRGLLTAGCPPERLVAIELDAEFAALLRRRFPRVSVIAGVSAAPAAGQLNRLMTCC